MSLPANRPVILTLLGAYWPGNDASGPIQSFRAMATALAGELEFRLVARDRPFGAGDSLVDAEAGDWTDLGFAKASYRSVGRKGADGLGRLLKETPHDVLWLNGFFDREFTIPALVHLRSFGASPPRAVLLSPRGEFGAGAIGLKSLRKRAYLRLAQTLGLLDNVVLHVTGEDECRNASAILPRSRIMVAPNIRLLETAPRHQPAEDGSLRLAFLGRISRVKNLDLALRCLAHVRSHVHLDIYGPAQDMEHWGECQELIAALPSHVTASHKGEIPNPAVPAALAACDLLLLPTRGENFGHAIFDALSCGVPVLISDKTPWRDLQAAEAGWDLPLDDPQRFADAIDALAAMPRDQRERLRQGARARAERWVSESDAVDRTRQMLQAAITNRAFQRSSLIE